MKGITSHEFARAFLAARPPVGWGSKIAVALSGGVDSVSLLFLLRQLVTSWKNDPSQFPSPEPPSIISFTVDHRLQPTSLEMSTRAHEISLSLQTPNRILRIPWSFPPYPQLEPNKQFEEVARIARYRILLFAMRTEGIDSIFMAHHADDQIETAMMRLSRSSGMTGVAGMRKVRRWGMGMRVGAIGWYGAEGMRKWIVRPLLDFKKERLIATCEENNLEFVQDSTNFMPDITVRNAIRHSLDPQGLLPDNMEKAPLKPSIARAIPLAFDRMSALVYKMIPDSEGTDVRTHFGKVVRIAGQQVEELDQQASEYLSSHTHPTPPSTLTLLPPLSQPAPPASLQSSTILRILRYISPFPWGSTHSEAHRKSKSIKIIASHLWGPSSIITPGVNRTAFIAGGNVMWTPVVVRKDGQMRISGSGEWDMNVGLKFGWIASRAPPIRGIRDGFLAGDDISAMVLEKLHLQSDERVPLEVLYDCRFLLRLRPERLPEWVMEVLSHSHNAWHIRIIPRGKYYLPTVVLRVEGHEDILLGGDGITSGISKDVKESEWLEIVFVRTLDAL